MATTRSSGLMRFLIIASSQLVSLVGTSMAGFALSIWAWQETGLATSLALIGFFGLVPSVFLSPVVGVLVDRWNRKLTMMLSDIGAGVSTIVTLVLLASGQLQVWHLFALALWSGVFETFQAPAYAATIGAMVPARHHGRAAGVMALTLAAANLVAPALAGLLLVWLSVAQLLWIDVATFCAATLTLAFVAVPSPPRRVGPVPRPWRAATDGFRYILRHDALRPLASLYFVISLVGAVGMVLLAPTILARSDQDTLSLGAVMSAVGLGGLVGGSLMSVWGGPKPRVLGVLGGLAGVGVFGYMLFGVGNTLVAWLVGAFSITFFVPILSGSNQALWLAAVPVELQGRVFATRQVIGNVAQLMVMLAAGPLADRVFEPAMAGSGWFAALLGPLVGRSEGSGMAAMFVLAGMLALSASTIASFIPSMRTVDASADRRV